MINKTKIGQTSGPAQGTMDRNVLAAQIPFVLPQVPFPGTNRQMKMGPGLLALVSVAAATTDITIKHNLGHPVNCIWAVMAPKGSFVPKVMISGTTLSNTTQQVIIQFDENVNPVTVAMF